MTKSLSLLSWWMPILAIPVGVAAAFITLGFGELLQLISVMVFGQPQYITQTVIKLPTYALPLLVTLGGVVAGFILKFAIRLENEVAKPTDYLEVINARLDAVPIRTSLLRSLSSLASIASGASIGKEGPMVQISALVGSLFTRLLPAKFALNTTDIVAMAAAAGLASVYHAPLASALFISEIAFGTFAVQRVIPLMLAALTSVITLWCFGISSPLYQFAEVHFELSPLTLLMTLLVAITSGLLASIFSQILRMSKVCFKSIPSLPGRLGLGGAAVGLLALVSPLVLGNGYEVIVELFSGKLLFNALLLLCAMKLIATCISVGSGAVGGMFTPSLLIGASWGGACGLLFSSLGWVIGSPWLFVAIGMAAMLSGMSRAPIMAIMMVLEMTLNSSLLLPLMLATSVATLIATRLNVIVSYPLVNTHFSKSIAKFSFDNAHISSIAIDGATLTPEDNIEKALRLCSVKRERYVYVIDDNRQFLGVVSVHNLTQQLLNQRVGLNSPVFSLLEREFPVVYQNQTLQEGWQAFTGVSLERLPVLNNPVDKQFVGALTKTSLLQQVSHFF